MEDRLCVIKKNRILKIVKNYRIPFKAIKKRKRAYEENTFWECNEFCNEYDINKQ